VGPAPRGLRPVADTPGSSGAAMPTTLVTQPFREDFE
jgi:hypothetical protein